MSTVSEQVQYESAVRFRYGAIAFVAAVLLVISQLLSLTGPHSQIEELTIDLFLANQRGTQDIVGALVDALGLVSAGVLLVWIHKISLARRPGANKWVRYIVIIGAALSAIMAPLYAIVIVHKAHEFVSTGNQGYPQAYQLTSGGALIFLPLLQQLGTLMLTIGCIWTSLSASRVGLLTRPVGYAGVLAGALFLFPVGVVVPIVQGFWLAAVAVICTKRWPSGDLPAWEQGIAVPWLPSAAQQQAIADRRAQRAQRGQRRKISDADVLAAVDKEPRPDRDSSSNQALGKRKRKRKS